MLRSPSSKWFVVLVLATGCSSGHLRRPGWFNRPKLAGNATSVSNLVAESHSIAADGIDGGPPRLPAAIEAPAPQHPTQPAHGLQPQSQPMSSVIPASNLSAVPFSGNMQ